MIGISSFILESMSFLIPFSLFLAGLYLIWFKKQKRGYVFAVLAGLMLFVMGVRYIYQVRNHLFLRQLLADDVAKIQIGDSTINKESDISLVVAALNERRWFSSNHGGWAEVVPFVITMKSNEQHRFSVGYYLRREGAVIEFTRAWGRSRWHDGYAFSERLPIVLKQVGVLLPSQSRTPPNNGMDTSAASEFLMVLPMLRAAPCHPWR